MYQPVSTVSTDLEMVLQLVMKVPFVVAALASGVVVLHVVRRRVRMAQGRAVALVVRVRAGHRDGWRKLIHARCLLVIHHLLLLLLLLDSARGRLLLLLLLAHRLSLRVVPTFAARVA